MAVLILHSVRVMATALPNDVHQRIERSVMENAWRILKHLFKRGHAPQRFHHSVLLHRAQAARFETELADLLHCPLLQNGISNFGIGHQQFVDSKPSAITGEVARRASLAPPQRELVQIVSLQLETPQHTIFRLITRTAIRA